MKLAKGYYSSPRWSGEITDCSLPMTFDQYSNCGFKCKYCFSQFQRGVGLSKNTYLHDSFKKVNIQAVKDLFLGNNLSKTNKQFSNFIKNRKMLQWGGLSDPFCLIEKKFGIGLELVKFFREIGYPVSFSTKGTWWVDDERYMSLFRGSNFHVKMSIITKDKNKSAFIEGKVPSPVKRLKAIEKLSKILDVVTLRLRPFIIGVTSLDYKQLIIDAANAGASSVSTEFFCLETRSVAAKDSYKKISSICGFDIEKFYRARSFGSGYLRLNKDFKMPYLLDMKRIAEENGMKFYVSDAHGKELSNSGCCCGLPEKYNYSRGQITEALLIAKKKGTVKWGDISYDLQYAKDIPYKTAQGFNSTSSEKRGKFYKKSMYDYLLYTWNSPKLNNSPYKYFNGKLKPTGVCPEGNLIYTYQEKK